MNLTDLNIQILEILNELNVKDLPELPNLKGVFEQTSLTFAIVKGQRLRDSRDSITVTFNVSVAATSRIKKERENTFYEDVTLYELIELVTLKLEGKKVRNGGLIRLSDFENFTPDSGKWRCLLSFDVLVNIASENLCEIQPIEFTQLVGL